MKKEYMIFLGDVKLGTSNLDKADVPMGAVFGRIRFTGANMGYDFIKNYCTLNEVGIALDFPEEKTIATRMIENMRILNAAGQEIKGDNNEITGTDEEGFEVSVEGIVSEVYAVEFPEHITRYENRYKKIS